MHFKMALDGSEKYKHQNHTAGIASTFALIPNNDTPDKAMFFCLFFYVTFPISLFCYFAFGFDGNEQITATEKVINLL